jgi:hypothetical protein
MLFNRPSAGNTLILSMLRQFRILIHLRIVALLRRKGMRDHLTRGKLLLVGFCGIGEQASRELADRKVSQSAMISW